MEKKERVWELDVLRAVAFSFVVLQHCIGSKGSNLDLPVSSLVFYNFLFSICEVGVPIFLFITGMTSAFIYGEKLNLYKYYKSRLLYLVIPYFLWSLYLMGFEEAQSIPHFILETFAGNGAFYLWYMGMAIKIALMMPLLIYIGRFIHKQHIAVRVLSFFGIYFAYFNIANFQGQIEASYNNLIAPLPDSFKTGALSISFLFWSFYLILGMYAGFNYKSFKENLIKYRYALYAVFTTFFLYKFLRQFSFLGFDLVGYSRHMDIIFRSSNILFWLLFSIKIVEFKGVFSIFEFISKYSYGAYFVHYKVICYCTFTLYSFNNPSAITSVLTIAISTILLSPFVIFLISLLPYSKFLTSVNSNYEGMVDKVKGVYDALVENYGVKLNH